MSYRRKTPEQERAEFSLMCRGLFLFWILANLWPYLLIMVAGGIMAVFFFLALPVIGIMEGDLEAFSLGAVILAVFAFVGAWYVVSARRERRGAVPPPELPMSEAVRKAEHLWKFAPEERPRKMTRAEKKKIAAFWDDPSAAMSRGSRSRK